MHASDAPFPRHRQLHIDGAAIHVVEGGAMDKPAVLFLHGWPECWVAFEQVMDGLVADAHVVAIDLPGVGGSDVPPVANDKRTLAKYVLGVIAQLGLRQVTLVGHDIGGMITYAFLRAWPGELARAVIMNTVIPGVDPWYEVERNPHIWHFAFHAVPRLPETLVAGHQADYFAFFYEALSASRGGVSEGARRAYAEAYARSQALQTGFEWYRAFAKDAQDNRDVHGQRVDTPLLYLRGEKESGIDLDRYVGGLRAAGMANVRGGVIPGSGHFAPDEHPQAVAFTLRSFMRLSP
jgi:pimeloyl-ACP methyl ester carboxylesterase